MRRDPPRGENFWTARVRITLKNISLQPVMVWGNSDDRYFDWDVIDEDGKPVLRTVHGEAQLRQIRDRTPNPFGGHAGVLQPGEDHFEVIDLAALFQLRRGSVYFAKAVCLRLLSDQSGKKLSAPAVSQAFELRPIR